MSATNMNRIPSSYTAAALAARGIRSVEQEQQKRGNGVDYLYEHTPELDKALQEITSDRHLQRLFHEHRQLKRTARRNQA